MQAAQTCETHKIWNVIAELYKVWVWARKITSLWRWTILHWRMLKRPDQFLQTSWKEDVHVCESKVCTASAYWLRAQAKASEGEKMIMAMQRDTRLLMSERCNRVTIINARCLILSHILAKTQRMVKLSEMTQCWHLHSMDPEQRYLNVYKAL